MGAVGDSVKSAVNNVVDSFPTAVTLTSRAPVTSAGDWGGYDTITENAGTPTATSAVPYDLVDPDLNLGNFGNLEAGEVRMVFKGGTSIDKDTKVTFNSRDWDIRVIEPIVFNDVEVALVVTLAPHVS